MKDLQKIKRSVESLDDELAALIARRLTLADEMAAARREAGESAVDPAWERSVLARVSTASGQGFSREIRTLYAGLLGLAKARQRVGAGGGQALLEKLATAESETSPTFPAMALVACPGAEGSYSQQAASRMFEVPSLLYFKGFDGVFEAVEKGACTYGVLPVENSSAGSVAAVYDLMQRHRFHIVRGVRLKVDHVLLANPGVRLEDVREIVSHPQALSQCVRFVKAHPAIRTVPGENTALAARQLAASGRKDAAVIASRACAELYGLDVLDEGVTDTPSNYTRFICIARKMEIYPDANKFALMLSLPHRPGALSDVIAKFAAIGVNLTKLESRPVLGSAFEFRFIFEFEASARDPGVKALLAELSADPEIERFTFLGAYAER